MNEKLKELQEAGFKGFKSVKELKMSLQSIPQVKGLYVVLRVDDRDPVFLENGTGGFFKKRNPNVTIEELESKWVDETPIVYIGQTERQLNKRIGELIKFGQGQAIGHWGGRLLWQLKDADSLIVAWKELSDGDPKEAELNMLLDFKKKYHKLPFANLR